MKVTITNSGTIRNDTWIEGEINGKTFVAVDKPDGRDLGPFEQKLTKEEVQAVKKK